jgi:hypothetical protein
VFFLAWCSLVVSAQPAAPQPASPYVGSAACNSCHAPIYARWTRTRMATVVRDPRVHPEAMIPDLTKPDPLVTFTKDDIAFVYGSKWKQRHFRRVGDDYSPLKVIAELVIRKLGKLVSVDLPTYELTNSHVF